jgi:hypothetical protein
MVTLRQPHKNRARSDLSKPLTAMTTRKRSHGLHGEDRTCTKAQKQQTELLVVRVNPGFGIRHQEVPMPIGPSHITGRLGASLGVLVYRALLSNMLVPSKWRTQIGTVPEYTMLHVCTYCCIIFGTDLPR